MCPTSRLGHSQGIGGLGATEGPQTGRSHRQTLSSCRKHQVTGRVLAGSHSTRKCCSEFFPFLCHCFTHSQENGLITLASSMKTSSHPWGWPLSLSPFLWLTSHVGLSLNYSMHHHLGPPFEIRKQSFQFSCTAHPAKSQIALEDKLQKLPCSRHPELDNKASYTPFR